MPFWIKNKKKKQRENKKNPMKLSYVYLMVVIKIPKTILFITQKKKFF